jgi:spermidine synthase
MALAIEAMRQARSRAGVAGLRIGAVGLGVGTVSAYARRGDAIRYYEIDPEVVRLSESHFSFRTDSEAREELVLGDARVSLEQELAEEKSQAFDVLVLDAFASDAVPVHLLTREAFDVYWRHLAPDGILAVHVSAIHLDLEPVVRGLARPAGKQTVRIINNADSKAAVAWSDWVLVTVNQVFLNSEDVARAASRGSSPPRAAVVWTDDHSNLLPLLRRAKE